ncbi:hypothetical protein [Neobacillus sp. Marseille-QA0830]
MRENQNDEETITFKYSIWESRTKDQLGLTQEQYAQAVENAPQDVNSAEN